MDTIETILLMLMVVDAVALGVLVLLQQGKGADIGAAFGSGSSNTVFGSAGSASFLAKLTTWLAIGFFLISFALAYTAKERAMALGNEGMPNIDLPIQDVQEQGTPADELTVPAEPVDSDIPDV